MKKFIKIFIIKFGGYISLILAAMLIIAYFFTVMYNFFNLNNIATFSLLHKEQQQSDIALQEYFNQVADSAAYIIYSEGDSIFDELRKFFPDLDITKKVYIDANGEVIPNMRQRKAFDTISTSAEDHASDHYGRDLNNSVIDPTLLRTLNQMLNNDDAFDVDILYAEGFVQPLPVVYDYRRCYVDEQGNIIDYVYVKKYDPETGVWLNPNGKIGTMIYEYVASEVDEDGNAINYQVDSMPTTTPYGTEKYGLKRIFYDTDEKGNPIVPKGYPTPQKHIQLAPVEDEYGNILLSSPIRFNADTTKTKKEIMADIDYEIVRQRVEDYIAETYGNQLVDIDTYNSIYYTKLSEYIEEKKEGEEGVDWEWDYKGKSKLMSILDENGNYILNPDISEKDFRYHIRKIDGKIVEVDMALEDPSYTNKCDEDYAWNEYLNFPVYRYEPENPVELAPRTLKDFGLAPVLLYDRAVAVSFKQLLYVDGKYDADAAQKYVTTHYNNQFTEANDGFFPAKIYETDEELKKVTTNDEVVDYLYDLVNSNSISVVQTDLQGRQAGSAKNSPVLNIVAQYDPLIVKYSTMFGVDPRLIRALIAQESSGNAKERSGSGWGLGQIEYLPYGAPPPQYRNIKAKTVSGETVTVHMRMTKDDNDQRLDPEQSIKWICAHFSNLQSQYNGDALKALLAYNQGAGTANRFFEKVGDAWISLVNKIREILNLGPVGDPNYISNVLRFYDKDYNFGGLITNSGSDYSNLNLSNSTFQTVFVGSVDHLFTDKTVGENGEWFGLSDWEKNNEEYNKEIKILSPYISNIGSKKDQIINPENYDEEYYNYLNKDRQITVNNFWAPIVNNILDSTIYKAQFIDDEVNNINNISEELKSHPQYQKIVNDINSMGKVILTDSSMTEDLFLIKEAVNPFGNFEYTYRKEARTERMLADHEQKAILTAYQVGRHWKALNWIVTYEIEKEKEVNDIEENEDGTIVILPTKHTETYTEEIQVDTIPVNLEVYSNDIPDLEYDDSDSGKVIAKGFIPNSDYKTAYDIKVPSYTVEYDGEGVVKKVKFKLEIEDNRNNGEIKYVYRYYAGDVKTVKPYPEETYFNGEVYSSWYNRLTTDQPGISYKAIEEEQESYFSYLKAYFTNYEMDIPKSAEKDPYAYDRTEEGYTDTIQHIVNKQISPETKAYGGTIIKALEQPQWKKIFTKMGLDQKYHKELVAQVIMGLMEEEQKQNDPNKKGICGIYVEPNETTIDAKRQWDNKDAISFTLIVNSTEDQRLDPGLSIQYMVAELGNLIMRFNGDICKAIQGYEMGGDALYNQINTILPLTDMDDFAATYDWSKNIIEYLKSTYHTTYTQRSKEEMLYFARQYGRPSMVDCNPRIVEDVIGYVNSYANQVKLAETTTKWYQEIWKKVKETVKDVGNYGKTLLERMGLLTSSKDQQITHIKNHKHEDYWIIFLRMVVAARQGIELEDVDEDITIFDLLNTIMSGDYISSNYTGMSSSISDFSGLIYNYEDYVIPLENCTITSGYGWRFHPTDKEIKFHNGIDLAANSGTPIHAVANGEVIVSGWNNSAGNWVWIKHPVEENNDKDYIISIYMHMNKQPNVRVGDKVKAGQVIGFVGSTGKSTGPHLHFELRINISQNNPNYSVWMSLVANKSTNSINPFWFSVNNPTPEQISKFSITKDRNSVVIK